MDNKISKLIDRQLANLVSKYDLSEKNIFVHPANEWSLYLIRKLKKENYTVINVIDSNLKLHGLTLDNVEITSVDVLIPYNKNNIILLTDTYDFTALNQMDFLEYWHSTNRFLVTYEKTNLLYRIKTKLNTIIRRLFYKQIFKDIKVLLIGKSIYKGLEKRVKHSLYIFPHQSIGDIYLLGLYKNSKVKLFDREFTLVVIGNTSKVVAEIMGFSNVISITTEDMNALVKFICINGEENTNSYILHFDYYHTGIVPDIVHEYKYKFNQCYDKLVFGEKWNDDNKAFRMPVKDVTKYCRDNGIEKGNSIILAPYAKSIPLLSPMIWESMAKILRKKGFKVFTNCVGDEMPVYGTKKVSFPLIDAISVLEFAGYFIGLRSGLCDYVSSANCKKVIIYPKMENAINKLINFYSFTDFVYVNNLIECECEHVTSYKNIENVINLLCSAK